MNWFTQRFTDLVLSVYLYNEWRGYVQMEKDLIPQLEADPHTDPEFLLGVRKHCADEKKHYNMFKGYFISKGRLPFEVGKSVGYFDFLCSVLLGRKDTVLTLQSFAKLCRAIVITEYRGINQVDLMLKWRSIRTDDRLRAIFQVIRQDEPSHFIPYVKWLEKNGQRIPSRKERIVDWIIHYGIAAFVIPFHFLNFRLKRVEAFAA